MGTLRLWKDGKRKKNYEFIDKIVAKHFMLAGTGVYVHKYLGPQSQKTQDLTISSDPFANETTIQDVLFLENRDRKYDPDVTELIGHYDIQELDFNLTQFGFMLSGATMTINFHINQMVERLGRKIMSGDVLEVRHKRDDLLLDLDASPINAFYVVTDASRDAGGYSNTWLPHIWRCRCEPLKDSQEFREIIDRLDKQGKNPSTQNKFELFNNIIDAEAQRQVDQGRMDSSHLYVAIDGKIPGDNLLNSYFNGDGLPPNLDLQADSGTHFPENAQTGEYFIRTDYNPPRLFRKEDCKWRMIEDVWRKTYVPGSRTLEDFLNNDAIVSFGPNLEEQIESRQPISKTITNRKKPPIDKE
jgi:hypothetical protein